MPARVSGRNEGAACGRTLQGFPSGPSTMPGGSLVGVGSLIEVESADRDGARGVTSESCLEDNARCENAIRGHKQAATSLSA